jgi:hypothetical protein
MTHKMTPAHAAIARPKPHRCRCIQLAIVWYMPRHTGRDRIEQLDERCTRLKIVFAGQLGTVPIAARDSEGRMSKSQDDYQKDAHTQGQRDGNDRKYDPPYDSIVYEFIERGDDAEAIREAYKDGWENGRDQRDGKV